MYLNSKYYDFIYIQLKSFSFIIFIITFMLLFLNNGINILPLNILVFFGSIFLFHFYPGYYKIVKVRDHKVMPLLIIYDIIFHYIPLLVAYKINKTTTTNYPLSVMLLFLYLIIFHSQLCNIYFKYNRFL
jgi:hypothetical protein